MSIEYWEAAVDGILTQHGVIFTDANLDALASEFKAASEACGDSMPPIYSAEKEVVTIETIIKSTCCDAEIIVKSTGLLNGGYTACSRCNKQINVNVFK